MKGKQLAFAAFLAVLQAISAQRRPSCVDNAERISPGFCAPNTRFCASFPRWAEQWCSYTCNKARCDRNNNGNQAGNDNNNQLQPSGGSGSCSGGDVQRAAVRSFQENSADFAWKLYQLAKAEANGGNVFFSPISISIALGMVLDGARGQTRSEMIGQMLQSVPNDQINKAYAWLMRSLNAGSQEYQLYTANSVYIEQTQNILRQYLNTVQQCFQSSAERKDFRNNPQGVRQEINRWVEGKTNDRIKDLIPPDAVDSTTKMILVNAIYFKADWMTPFTESEAYDGRFYPLNQPNGVTAKMMNRKVFANYYEDANLDVQVLGLPYKKDELAMYIFLPKQRNGLPQLEQQLTSQRMTALINQASGSRQRRKVDVTIPKFKMTQNIPLKKMLQSMGMRTMFENSADFSGMTGRRDLKVSDAIHKAFIEVNEKGTEAAAATGIVMTFKSGGFDNPPVFIADHPFLFAIQHKASKTLLFMGTLHDLA